MQITIQTFLVALVILMAIGYAARRIYRALENTDAPCRGCNGCALGDKWRGQKHENKPAEHENAECPYKK